MNMMVCTVLSASLHASAHLHNIIMLKLKVNADSVAKKCKYKVQAN